MKFPANDRTPLIRTDFSDDAAWHRIVEAASASSPDGFRANLHVVDDRSFEKAAPSDLSADAGGHHHLLIIADGEAMRDPEMALLCVDPGHPGQRFRVIPAQLWGVENNVSLANMDFDEFTGAVDPDGVFRGFRD